MGWSVIVAFPDQTYFLLKLFQSDIQDCRPHPLLSCHSDPALYIIYSCDAIIIQFNTQLTNVIYYDPAQYTDYSCDVIMIPLKTQFTPVMSMSQPNTQFTVQNPVYSCDAIMSQPNTQITPVMSL